MLSVQKSPACAGVWAQDQNAKIKTTMAEAISVKVKVMSAVM